MCVCFIERKNHGSLVIPADDVVDVCICAEKVFRWGNKSGTSLSPLNTIACMVSEVLTMCIRKPLFPNLIAHMSDQLPLDNRLVLLVKAIAKRYLESRMSHAARMLNDRAHTNKIRCKYTKLTIFEGQ